MPGIRSGGTERAFRHRPLEGPLAEEVGVEVEQRDGVAGFRGPAECRHLAFRNLLGADAALYAARARASNCRLQSHAVHVVYPHARRSIYATRRPHDPRLAGTMSSASLGAQTPVSAPTDGGYRLVPNWPTLPPGDFFGLKNAPPPPAEREAQAAARRATGQAGNAPTSGGPGPDQSARHFRPRDRSAGSHLRVQPRRQAGDGLQHRRQVDRVGRRSGAQRQEARSELAALRRRWTGRATST